MLRLAPFDLHRPRTLVEALTALAARDNGMCLAGGTDLVPKLKRRQFDPEALVSLADVAELRGFHEENDRLIIGALTSLNEIDQSSLVRRHDVLAQAVRTVATPTLRRNGTLGGNLLQDTRCRYYDRSFFWRDAIGYCLKKNGTECLVAPGGHRCFATLCSDIAPALIVLDATVTLARLQDGAAVERTIPLEQLYRDDGMAHLNMDREILVRATIHDKGFRSAYKKLRWRDVFDFPELGLAVAIRDTDGRVQINVGASGVSAQIFVARETVARAELSGFADRVYRAIKPMDTLCAPPAYRKRVARNFLEQAISELLSDR